LALYNFPRSQAGAWERGEITKKGVSPFLTIADIAALISGGVRGVVKK